MKTKQLILKTVLIGLFLIKQQVAMAAPVISNIVAPTSISKYDKYEVGFTLGNYINPYNPNEINAFAEFTAPSGKIYTVNAFYYNGTTNACDANGYETVNLTAVTGWKVRFSPNETGQWAYRIRAIDGTGSSNGAYLNFTCNNSVNHGFISKANLRYLKYDDGTPYYPVGDNIPWFDRNPWRGQAEKGTCQITTWIDQLAANNANFARLEINFFEGLNIMGYDFRDGKNYYTYFNQKDSWQLDRIIDYAKSKNVNLLLALFSHGSLGDAHYCNNTWSLFNPFNANIAVANKPQAPDLTGNITSPFAFFSDATAIDIQKRLIRYIMARWGYATNMVGLELMDEADRIDVMNPQLPVPPNYSQDLINWHSTIKNYINSVDPFKHLVTTAFAAKNAAINTAIQNTMDYTQIHNYTNMDKRISGYWQGDFEEENFTQAAMYYSAFQKPNQTGEIGWYSILTNLALDDPNFYALHCLLWSHLFNGSMGSPAFWIHSDMENIGANTIANFKGVGAFSKNLPQFSEQFIPTKTYTTNFRMYYLKHINGDKYYGWAQDRNFALRNILDNYPAYLQNFSSNRPPQGANNTIAFPVSKNGLYDVKWYDTETGLLYTSQVVAASGGSVSIAMPANLRSGKYADAGFTVTYQCAGHFNAGILNANAPSNVVLSSDIETFGNTNVFFVGNDSRIHEMYWNQNYYWQEATLNSNAPANVRAGSDVATNSAEDVFFIATDNRVHKYTYTGGQWVEAALNLSYPGNVRNDSPLAAFSSGNVFFIGTDNKVHVYYYSGGQWNDAVLNASAPANVKASSDLAVNGSGNVFFTGTDNRVHYYYYVGAPTNQWLEAALNPSYPANVRADSKLTTDATGNVYFVATDNRVHIFYYTAGQWTDAVLNPNAPANVKANSDVVCDKTSGKIYFIGTDNRVHQYYYAGAPTNQWVEAVNNTNDPTNAVTYLAVDLNGNVYYNGANNKIYASYWDCQSYFRESTSIDLTPLKNNTQLSVRVYPNPSSGLFSLELPENNYTLALQIEVLDIKGMKVYSKKAMGEKVVNLDLSHLSNGIYILKVIGGDFVQVNKLIKD